MLRMGIHAYAMGEGKIRREPQREGREDASTGGPLGDLEGRLSRKFSILVALKKAEGIRFTTNGPRCYCR
jgi:hypothetical protein